MLTKFDSLIDELRHNTHALHRKLDQSPLVRQILSPDLTITEYKLLLERFYQVYNIVEPALLAFELTQGSARCPKYQVRLPALSKELAALNYPIKTAFNDHSAFSITSQESYLGIRYVVDGSCHGAKFLLPRLTRHFHSPYVNQLAYWKLLDSLNSDWQALVQALDAYRHNQQIEIINAAKNTFKLFIAGIEPSEVTS